MTAGIIPLFQVTDSQRGYGNVTLKGTCQERVTNPAIMNFAAAWVDLPGLPMGHRDFSRSQDKKSWSVTIHTN
jgi:hypothetical protein